jgi:pre-mRNA-splicing factor RBM22/SLT11
MLKSLARTDPFYKRNRPHVCSFYVKGECKRGTECPYRHEKPVDNELAHQNMQDRYHGRNDPVANKILGGHAEAQGLIPPEDITIVSPFPSYPFISIHQTFIQTSLFLSLLSSSSTEQSIRTRVLQSLPAIQPTNLKSIVHVAKTKFVIDSYNKNILFTYPSSRCAFVNFKDRASAEHAAQAWANGVEIDGETVSVKWGRSRPKNPPVASSSSSSSAQATSVQASAS